MWAMNFLNIYVYLVSFFNALFFNDWMTAQSDAAAVVYDILTPLY
jgi:hypothetical protein